VCDPLSYELRRVAIELLKCEFFFMLSTCCKALSLGSSQFLGGTLSVLLQNLRVLLRCINIHNIEYSDV